MIPGPDECFQLMERYRMLGNIRDHSVMVARVAEKLTEECNRAGLELSVGLTVSAALLHDIGKTSCLGTDRDHARLGRDICVRHGFSELAGIVADHVRLERLNLPDISENELVFYADKRVKHDQIVSLEERLEYIVERYGRNDPERRSAIEKNCRPWWDLEKQLFRYVRFAPEDLAGEIVGISRADSLGAKRDNSLVALSP